MTVRELAAHAGLSVEALVALAHGRKPPAATSKATSKKAAVTPKTKAAATGPNEVDTRNAKGRAAYQKAVLETLKAAKGEKLGAREIRAAVGGTGLQARTAITVLIESKKVRFEGKARATRYWAK